MHAALLAVGVRHDFQAHGVSLWTGLVVACVWECGGCFGVCWCFGADLHLCVVGVSFAVGVVGARVGNEYRRVQGATQTVCRSSSVHRATASVEHHHEFVAAEASEHIALAHRARKALGDLLQEFITNGMAEAVVDHLEVIEVDEQATHHRRCGAIEALREDR